MLRIGAPEPQRISPFLSAAPRPRVFRLTQLTLVQVIERLRRRLEKRMESLQRVKLAGFDVVIVELEMELDYLRRTTWYLEE
jgi:hypothetical protein